MPAIEEFLTDATRRMDKSIESTRQEFNSVRTGRASPALLDRVQVDYYGTPTPLKNLATISAPEPRLLNVQPFDPTSVKAIEKAIQESDLGLQPSNDGKLIRLPIPQLTEERRKELVKVVRRYAEDGKVAIRNVRRDVMRHLEELVRNGEVGEDEVEALMELFAETIERELPDLAKEGVRTRFVGRRDRAPAELRARMAALEEETAANERLQLWIAFDYGGRAELAAAARRLVEDGVEPDEIDEEALAARLYEPDMPDPDLLIRTSGELRISNFLLWQLAYAELVFVDRLWPDLGEADLRSALEGFARPRRRFGGR